MENPYAFLNPGYFENHTIFVYLTNENLVEIPPPLRYREDDDSYAITKYPKDGSINTIEKHYIFPRISVLYIEMEKMKTEVVEVVWYTCEDCDSEGMYPIYSPVACPDCGEAMLSAHPEKVKKDS